MVSIPKTSSLGLDYYLVFLSQNFLESKAMAVKLRENSSLQLRSILVLRTIFPSTKNLSPLELV